MRVATTLADAHGRTPSLIKRNRSAECGRERSNAGRQEKQIWTVPGFRIVRVLAVAEFR
jgi:hypothetical protein